MTTEPNWDEAPEGATHWESDQLGASGWLMKEKDSWHYWSESSFAWRYMAPPSDHRMHFIYPRPAPWTGAGLPPVGEVCEARHEEINNGLPVRAEILKHHANGKSAAFYWIDAPEGESNLLWAGRFFPIRTQEQIAEEEREESTLEMQNVLRVQLGSSYDSTKATLYSMILYDAGWRREAKS